MKIVCSSNIVHCLIISIIRLFYLLCKSIRSGSITATTSSICFPSWKSRKILARIMSKVPSMVEGEESVISNYLRIKFIPPPTDYSTSISITVPRFIKIFKLLLERSSCCGIIFYWAKESSKPIRWSASRSMKTNIKNIRR